MQSVCQPGNQATKQEQRTPPTTTITHIPNYCCWARRVVVAVVVVLAFLPLCVFYGATTFMWPQSAQSCTPHTHTHNRISPTPTQYCCLAPFPLPKTFGNIFIIVFSFFCFQFSPMYLNDGQTSPYPATTTTRTKHQLLNYKCATCLHRVRANS